jgi:hypothetical protein
VHHNVPTLHPKWPSYLTRHCDQYSSSIWSLRHHRLLFWFEQSCHVSKNGEKWNNIWRPTTLRFRATPPALSMWPYTNISQRSSRWGRGWPGELTIVVAVGGSTHACLWKMAETTEAWSTGEYSESQQPYPIPAPPAPVSTSLPSSTFTITKRGRVAAAVTIALRAPTVLFALIAFSVMASVTFRDNLPGYQWV